MHKQTKCLTAFAGFELWVLFYRIIAAAATVLKVDFAGWTMYRRYHWQEALRAGATEQGLAFSYELLSITAWNVSRHRSQCWGTRRPSCISVEKPRSATALYMCFNKLTWLHIHRVSKNSAFCFGQKSFGGYDGKVAVILYLFHDLLLSPISQHSD